MDGTSKLAVNVTNTVTETLAGTNTFTGGITNSSTGTINYGHGETNSPILNYPVTFVSAGSKMNFNISGNYTFNDTTITGPGTFGENNSNMVMHLNQPLVNFTGTNHVLFGTFDLNSVNGNGPIMAGGITVDSNTNATLMVEDQGRAYPEIGGNLNLGALSTVIFNFDVAGVPISLWMARLRRTAPPSRSMSQTPRLWRLAVLTPCLATEPSMELSRKFR